MEPLSVEEWTFVTISKTSCNHRLKQTQACRYLEQSLHEYKPATGASNAPATVRSEFLFTDRKERSVALLSCLFCDVEFTESVGEFGLFLPQSSLCFKLCFPYSFDMFLFDSFSLSLPWTSIVESTCFFFSQPSYTKK